MKRINGFTLIEMMVVLAILGIVMSIAVPSYLDLIDKQRLKEATESFYSTLQSARSLAKTRSEKIYIDVDTSSSNWCLGVNTAAACNCTNTTACTTAKIQASDFNKISIKTGGTLDGQYYDPVRGVLDPNGGSSAPSITLVSARGKEATINISTTGEVSHCSPAGATHIGDYATC
jgi:type II secretion system protein H